MGQAEPATRPHVQPAQAEDQRSPHKSGQQSVEPVADGQQLGVDQTEHHAPHEGEDQAVLDDAASGRLPTPSRDKEESNKPIQHAAKLSGRIHPEVDDDGSRSDYLAHETVQRDRWPHPTHLKKATTTMAKAAESASQLVDGRIRELGDWRGETLARIRSLIKQADPEVIEEWKWRGVPVWSHAGIICTGETYKKVVKTTFFKGASLEDPSDLFNSSLEGNTRRAIDFHEGDEIDEEALKALVRAAVSLNTSSA